MPERIECGCSTEFMADIERAEVGCSLELDGCNGLVAIEERRECGCSAAELMDLVLMD